MGKFIKRLVIGIFLVLFLFVVAVIAAPQFFKDHLIKVVKETANEQIEGEVDFSDVSVSWWKTFPDVSVTLDSLRVTGSRLPLIADQKGLLSARSLSLAFDFMSAWRQSDSLQIQSFSIEDLVAHVYVDNNNQNNYTLVNDDAEGSPTESGKSLALKLDDYSIINATITYHDFASNKLFSTEELNHSGKLNYKDNLIEWSGLLDGSHVSLVSSGVPYLKNVRLKFDGGIAADLNSSTYTFQKNALTLNNLIVTIVGNISDRADGYNMNLNFNTDKNEFGDLLSLIPAIYRSDLKDITASGALKLGGQIKGLFAANGKEVPVYAMNLSVQNGAFKVPKERYTFDQIDIDAAFSNTKNDWSPTTINVPSFHFELDDEPFDGKLMVTSTKNDQLIDAELKGKIDLKKIYAVAPMESIDKLEGLIDADVKIKGSVNDMTNGAYQNVTYSGQIVGKSILVATPDNPTVQLDDINATIKNNALTIPNLSGKIGKSDMKGSMEIKELNNLFVTTKKPMVVNGAISGNRLDFNEFIVAETNGSAQATEESISNNDLLKNTKFNFKGNYKEVLYEDYTISNSTVNVSGDLNSLAINEFKGTMNNSAMDVNGQINNIYGYLYDNQSVNGKIKAKIPTINADQWMTETMETAGGQTTTATVYAEIPPRINLDIELQTDDVTYQNYQIKDGAGDLKIADQVLSFNNVKGNTLGGDFLVNGVYAFAGVGKPTFKFDYNLKNFSYEQTAQNVSTLQKLVPLLNYIKGKFNSQMSFDGELGDDYFPVLNNLSGNGLFESLSSVIETSPILKKLGEQLNVRELQKLQLDHNVNKFKFQEGTFSVEPINLSKDDMKGVLSGSHKLTGEMNYDLTMLIPIDKFNSKKLPVDLSKELNSFTDKLKSLGINAQEIKEVSVGVHISGTLSNPTFKLKLNDVSDGKLKNTVKDISNQVINKVRDTVKTEVKTRIIKEVLGDSSGVTTVKDAVKVRTEKEVQKKVDEVVKPAVDTFKKKIEDEVKDKVGDELKDKIKDWNPFKKKKDGN